MNRGGWGEAAVVSREKRKKYEVLGNLTPVSVLSLSLSLRDPARSRSLGPTGRRGEPERKKAPNAARPTPDGPAPRQPSLELPFT